LAQLSEPEKRCRTATPWPIALCSGPVVGCLNQALMTNRDIQVRSFLGACAETAESLGVAFSPPDRSL